MQRVFGPPPRYEQPAETPSREERQLVRDTATKVNDLTEGQQKRAAARRELYRFILRERATDPSNTTIQTSPETPARRRITSLILSTPNAGTLNIGPLGAPWMVIPVPTGTTAWPGLGDAGSGGLILEPGEVLQLVNGGAAGRMSILPFGEIIPETQEV